MVSTVHISGRVSVVIPTLNEADRLPQLLSVLASELYLREIIVADGGSNDGTQVAALQLGAKVISTQRGRGRALREGAAVASGDILLFLHADSIFPRNGLGAIVGALDHDKRIVGGNFRVVFDLDTPFARRLTHGCANFRCTTTTAGFSSAVKSTMKSAASSRCR